jgi:hypothetical protein
LKWALKKYIFGNTDWLNVRSNSGFVQWWRWTFRNKRIKDAGNRKTCPLSLPGTEGCTIQNQRRSAMLQEALLVLPAIHLGVRFTNHDKKTPEQTEIPPLKSRPCGATRSLKSKCHLTEVWDAIWCLLQ